MSALPVKADIGRVLLDVWYGSKAGICVAKSDVRFTPNSDHESGHPHIMSALPPIADMCGAIADVCFGPKADIGLRDANGAMSGAIGGAS